MGKVIKLKTETDNVLDFLENIKEVVKQDKMQSLLFAGKCENGEFIVGHTEMDIASEIELKSHLETNIINDMIKQNYVIPE